MHFYQKPYISFALYEQFNHNCQLHSNSPHFILCTFLSCSDVHWHFADNATLLRDFSLTVSAAPWGNFPSVSYLSDASVDEEWESSVFGFFRLCILLMFFSRFAMTLLNLNNNNRKYQKDTKTYIYEIYVQFFLPFETMWCLIQK